MFTEWIVFPPGFRELCILHANSLIYFMAHTKGGVGKTRKGFTLIELLIVIAIIVILAAAVFVALNPAKRFADARNARRQNDVASILSALKTAQVDNGGTYITNVAALTAATNYVIGTNSSGCNSGCGALTTAAACADVTDLVTQGYLGSVPADPSTGAATFTDYYINRSASGTLTVGACDAENGASIVVSR